MARRIREFDWAKTSLGDIESWPQSLKTAIQIMLDNVMLSTVAVGPHLILLYNDAAAKLYGPRHADALGHPLEQAFPEGGTTVRPLYDKVFGGESVTVSAMPLDTRGEGVGNDIFDAFLTPVRDEAGSVVSVFMTGFEISGRLAADRSLKERESRSHRRAQWLAGQNEAFKSAVNGAPLATSLDVLTRTAVAQLGEDVRCAFYIVDNDAATVSHVVGMPADYAQEVDGLAIGANSLACGLALGSREAVLTRDVHDEPLWHPWLWLAEKYDYRGCWSFPVESAGGQLVGSFAWYFREPRSATPEDLELAQSLVGTASIIITHNRNLLAARESEQRLRALVTAGTLSTYRMSPDWRLMYELDSDTLAATTESIEDWPRKYILQEDQPRVYAAINEAIRTKSLFELEHRVRLDNGGVGWVLSRAVPLLDDDGEIKEWFGAGSDVTTRMDAQTALSESEAKYRGLFESIETGYCIIEVIFDEAGRPVDYVFVETNPAFVGQTGLTNATGKRIRELVRDNEEFWFETYGRIAKTGVSEQFEHRADGLERWYSVNAFRLGDPSQNRVAVLFEDIRERKRAEERQSMLLGELQHRVRNTLAVVRSIARRTADRSETIDDMISHFEGRLNAFSRVQSAVARNPGAGLSLESIIEDELVSVAAREGEQFQMKGPDVALRSRPAESISLAIHELATNAVKYGALSKDNGLIKINWAVMSPKDGDRRLHLEWVERGLDIPPRAAHEGFGHEMLRRSLPYDLGAETDVQFTEDGLRFTLSMQLGPDVMAEDYA